MADGLDDFLETRTEDGATGEEEAAESARVAAEAEAAAEKAAAEEAERAAAAKNDPAKAEEGLKAALLAERQRRQAAEEALQAAKKQQEEEDPYAAEIKRELQEALELRLATERINLSESFAREKYADFDEKLEIFKGMIQENPALYPQMAQQANPAEFMYKTALSQQKLKEMGNPLEYEKSLRDKIKAELKAELEAEEKKRKELPGSIATAAGAGGSRGESWGGPTPLKELF